MSIDISKDELSFHSAIACYEQKSRRFRQRQTRRTATGCMKKGGVDYPDNLIGIATCSVADHRDSGEIVGKYGEWRLYRIGEHNQAYRLELETEGATHFHEFNSHHIQVNSERNRITFTQPSSS